MPLEGFAGAREVTEEGDEGIRVAADLDEPIQVLALAVR